MTDIRVNSSVPSLGSDPLIDAQRVKHSKERKLAETSKKNSANDDSVRQDAYISTSGKHKRSSGIATDEYDSGHRKDAGDSSSMQSTKTDGTEKTARLQRNRTLRTSKRLGSHEDGIKALHVSSTDPSMEEIKFAPKLPEKLTAEVKELEKSMKNFFLNPMKRDMTLRVITLFLDSLAKEFSAQLDFEVVQTKLKVSSIMNQRDQLQTQAITKLAGGITESVVTGMAAGMSIASASKGLNILRRTTKENTASSKTAQKGTEESQTAIKELKTELAGHKDTANKMANNPKFTNEERAAQAEKITHTENRISANEDAIEGYKSELKNISALKDTTMRKIDLTSAKLNGFSQLISSSKGLISGGVDYIVTMQQANIKLQDAVQAGIQLSKDNARLFMQKSNEYISSLLSSMGSIISSTYQARRGIITS